VKGPRIGVSACLEGEPVRYDGGDKRSARLLAIAAELERVPVCPEAELGLGVPRPTMHLAAGDDGRVHLIVTASGQDRTDSMTAFADERIAGLGPLDGYVLKARSPSCAVGSAAVARAEMGPGLFAMRLIGARPELPVCEETDLEEPRRARSFVRQVFTAFRVRELFAGAWTLADLVAHHTDHKLLLFSRDPCAARELGALVAGGADLLPAELEARYRRGCAAILAQPSRPGREVDALQHCVGWLDGLSVDERRDVHARIAEVAAGRLAAHEVAIHVRSLAERYQVAYLIRQHYLLASPHEQRALARCSS